ncbi:glucose-1-phosphate adenylyltransferase [Fervidicella metallireducens AeB]|uniref:Glucose-1-phosphate adenylyltransferase n=1 Tax=Fervidicella metallireducens AeB TaxID=1403537 RepID=A0A017RTH9_9CLOT|nr:glucose-1-phosphate adenylyltransferase [Fervidicella metallireducens]EYE87769.1 glucose-1-phosphate adenylyltransferase [Fervidicella metallireducens AeB]
MKKEIIAMLLAGGKGTRLGPLTKKLAKPAVYFGGKYRIIDFPLSNCANSHIDIVGVLTQYESILLNSHIGVGANWGLNTLKGGVTILPPRETEQGGQWYRGTADAIYQNIDFIDNHNPENVLILSGDHIYKMDYSLMLDFHTEKEGDATIAVIEVPIKEASRFGIMNTDETNRICEFEEKPQYPQNNLASMGIYIFKWSVLRDFLCEDAKDSQSEHDFGKNIIPKMLHEGKRMFAYKFNGYWKDVGTIESLWEANMDLLKDDNSLNLYDNNWKIYTDNVECLPQYVSNDAVIKNSIISQGSMIYGEVHNSIIFSEVYIGKGTKVVDSVIMPKSRIEDGAIIEKSIVDSEVVINKNSKIGNKDGKEIFLISQCETEEI